MQMISSSLKRMVSHPSLRRNLLKTPTNLFANPVALVQPFTRHFARSKKVVKSTPQKTVTDIENPPTANEVIHQDHNLNKFMTKIYKTTGLSFVAALGTSYAIAASVPITASVGAGLALGGLLTCWAGMLAMHAIPQTKITQTIMDKSSLITTTDEKPKGEIVTKFKDPFSRKLAYSVAILGSGITASPAIYFASMLSPTILPLAAGLSFLTMGGASLYAMYKPLGSFKTWESVLYGSLAGMIGMSLLSTGLTFTIGPNPLSAIWYNPGMYLGVGLFAAFQAFDTQNAILMFKEGKYDHLNHSLKMFLNLQNLIIDFIMIISHTTKK